MKFRAAGFTVRDHGRRRSVSRQLPLAISSHNGCNLGIFKNDISNEFNNRVKKKTLRCNNKPCTLRASWHTNARLLHRPNYESQYQISSVNPLSINYNIGTTSCWNQKHQSILSRHYHSTSIYQSNNYVDCRI